MTSNPLPPLNTRIGFHYFPDTLHYRESDLQTWLPELRAMGATWLTLATPLDRAIPEYFINGLLRAGIEPILFFQNSIANAGNPEDMRMLFNSYAKWGVHYVVLFDRPNSRAAWPAAAWVQDDLVERFLDAFLPLAELALDAGLTPVFPPLEPGGDYWDTAFLKAALLSMQRRKQDRLLDALVLSAYVWYGEHSLNWGAGGPERWPGTRPYFTPTNEEDQRGFRIFDWYLAISRSVLKEASSMLLFAAGSPLNHRAVPPVEVDPTIHAQICLCIGQLMAGETVKEAGNPEVTLEPIPDPVLACSYWLLTAPEKSPQLAQAWYRPDGSTLPVVSLFRQWTASWPYRSENKKELPGTAPANPSRPVISHYLLLPTYEWGVSDWHLEIIRPFVKKYQPTIGFSIEEASRAARVTVVGGPQTFSDKTIEQLRSGGCQVERISGDGTSIATQLAER